MNQPAAWTEPGAADRLRSSPEQMRAAVHDVALGQDWPDDLTELVTRLEEVARVDLCLARLVEGHADAMRILDQAATKPEDGVYGVWASRSVGTGLRASRAGTGWRLRGEVRFASGIDIVDRVLVPGWIDDERHLLFDVPIEPFEPDRATWRTSAMDASRSFTVRADLETDREPVGPDNFYLQRPGFVLGGLGPAAVWAGGGRSVVDLVATGLRAFTPSPHQLRRLGVMDQAAWQADAAVRQAASGAAGTEPHRVAREVTAARTSAVEACERVVDEAGRVVGPGGLSTNPRLARTLADLLIYVRQHHLDATWEVQGRAVLETGTVAG